MYAIARASTNTAQLPKPKLYWRVGKYIGNIARKERQR